MATLANYSDKARSELLRLLADIPGRKNLVLQKGLVGPVELLVKFSTLQEQGVDRIFFLENDNVDSSQRNVVFVLSGEKAPPGQALAVKRLEQTASTEHDFSVIWTPRRSLVCDKILEDHGVLGDITSFEWPLYFHTLEHNVLSLELDNSFQELYLVRLQSTMLTQRHDPTSIFLAAKALSNIEREHGLFPRILGKGDNARRLAELVQRLRYEFQASDSDTSRRPIGTLPSTTIENLIIIDRSVDYATPLLTQLTYEGLVDEKFGIVHSHAEINASIAGASTGSGAQATRKVKLDSTDKLFDQLRGLHFSVVGGVLNKTARRLQTDYEERHGDKSVAELKEFVKKLPGYQNEQQSLKVQTNLAEEIVKESRTEQFARALEVQQNLIAGTDLPSVADLVEDLIARNCPLGLAIRMLCLASVVGGGLRAREYDGFRRAIVQAYGYEQLVTLDNLNKMQLLQLRGGLNPFAFGANQAVQNTDYATARRSLELIVNEVSEQDPQDIAYVFSGYAPLSVRLVQCILQKQHLAKLTKSSAASAVTESSSGWRGFEDALKSVRGALVDEGTQPGDGAAKARATLAGSGRKKTTLVFFLGGITFAEIAALQFIARQEAERRDIVICTTSIISGNKMVRAAQTVD